MQSVLANVVKRSALRNILFKELFEGHYQNKSFGFLSILNVVSEQNCFFVYTISVWNVISFEMKKVRDQGFIKCY